MRSIHHCVPAGLRNTARSALYCVLYVFCIYFVFIQIIHEPVQYVLVLQYVHVTCACTTYRTRGPWHPSRLPRSCRPCSRPRSCRPCSRPRSRRPCSRPSNLRQCSRSVECAHSVALVLYFFNTDQCAMYCVLYVFLFIFYNTVFFITQPCLCSSHQGTWLGKQANCLLA